MTHGCRKGRSLLELGGGGRTRKGKDGAPALARREPIQRLLGLLTQEGSHVVQSPCGKTGYLVSLTRVGLTGRLFRVGLQTKSGPISFEAETV